GSMMEANPQASSQVMANNFLNLLSESRTRIVQFIKSQGDASVEEVAQALGLAGSTIRQHLELLEEKGLLKHESVAKGPGRPTSRYRLTPSGRQLFPSQ